MRPATAAFVMEYSDRLAVGELSPLMLPIVTILPPSVRCGDAALIPAKTARTLTATISSKSAKVAVSTSPIDKIPALFTRISSPPSSSAA
ncbi:Uncharacterised protein [Mycobacteroides abscessus subsp. abscessus]|nr:Uncharacterised protein [Mycobacteroides abscessus subsp. abscessus]